MNKSNKYKAFYNGRTASIAAETSYKAHQAAVKHFAVRKNKAHMVTVVLCERSDGSQVIHSTAEI